MVDADRHDGEPFQRHPHLGVDVDLGVVRNREDRRQLLDRAHLHAQEAEPASRRVALPGRLGVIERDRAVDGDGVMQRLQERPTFAVQLQDPRTHALVVVDDVEVATTVLQDLLDAQGVRERLAEPAGHHDAELREVGHGPKFRDRRDAKRVGVAVEVEAAHGGKADALVEFGPGRTGKYFDAVPEVDQFARQVSGVDALTAAARVTPVDQERHAALARLRRFRTDVAGREDCFGTGPGRLGLVDGLAQGTGQGATFTIASPPFSPNSPKAHKCPRTNGFHH